MAICIGSVLIVGATAHAQDQTTTDHVAPPPPQTPMPPMTDAQMVDAMQMDDSTPFAMFKLDEWERGKSGDAYATTWNAQAWYGGDFDKVWLRTEGEREFATTDARIEAFWDHAFASYWDWQIGARRDFGDAPGGARPGQNWAALGVQGIAPYWFEVEATAYLAEQGRSAARFRAEYEILLTQRWIVTSEVEVNLYTKSDRVREVAAGLSDADFGVRLRYEIRREFAPYAGIVWNYRRAVGGNALVDFQRAGTDCEFVIGVRLWL
jgi:copper resistance protein B